MFPELTVFRRCKLVVVAIATGSMWGDEAAEFQSTVGPGCSQPRAPDHFERVSSVDGRLSSLTCLTRTLSERGIGTGCIADYFSRVASIKKQELTTQCGDVLRLW